MSNEELKKTTRLNNLLKNVEKNKDRL